MHTPYSFFKGSKMFLMLLTPDFVRITFAVVFRTDHQPMYLDGKIFASVLRKQPRPPARVVERVDSQSVPFLGAAADEWFLSCSSCYTLCTCRSCTKYNSRVSKLGLARLAVREQPGPS
nr:hypothetical protein CFP56_44442 [Quercus suber]